MKAVVKTRQGEVRGSVADGVNTFKGLLYATIKVDVEPYGDASRPRRADQSKPTFSRCKAPRRRKCSPIA